MADDFRQPNPRLRQAENARQFMLANARGMAQWPDAVSDYWSRNGIGGLLSDAGGVVSNMAQSAYDDPKGFIADMIPVVGEARSAGDTQSIYAQIQAARISGDNSKADELESMLPLMSLGAIPLLGGIAGKITKTATKGAVKTEAKAAVKAAVRSTDLPNLREMPVTQAVATAKKDPHLIKAGDQSQSYYVGGPREVQSKRGLTNKRKEFDAYVAADPRGGDWYDRYRNGVTEVTGGNPQDNLWMASQEGQWSAGVSPEGELGFALKENNGSLLGYPVKSARPAQHEAHTRALEANDPNLYQLGEKTGEYARLVSPDQFKAPGATGVNDFRHARNFGYTETDGSAQRNALTDAQHTFLDYETAGAVGRANDANLSGRSNWTGEQLQAAPWVRQKALDLLGRNQNGYAKRAEEILASQGSNIPPGAVEQMSYELAFQDANKTIADYFDKHTAFATHESMIGPNTGHLPLSANADMPDRLAFAADPRSSWANAPGGRDAIYGGLRYGETGNAARVRPTQDMQGLYQPPGGLLEANPGEVARPLVAFDNDAKGLKSLPAGDRAMLEGGESLRAYVDAQDAGAAHKPWFGGRAGDSNSLYIPLDRPATVKELISMRDAASPFGLGDVVDTGQGMTVTQFYPGAPKMEDPKGLLAAVTEAMPADAKGPRRAKVDSIYADFVDAWKSGEGSGVATRQLLEKMNVTPEARQAFNNNPYLASNSLARLERDEAWSAKWGATRKDIQKARRIIADGPGWIDRMEAALKSGVLLPAVGAAVLVGASQQGGQDAGPAS